MIQPTTGFIVYGVHKDGLSDPLGAPFIDDAVVFRSREALRSSGLKVKDHPVVIATKAEARAALDAMKKDDDVDCVVLFSGTWVWAAHLVAAVQDLQKAGQGGPDMDAPGLPGMAPRRGPRSSRCPGGGGDSSPFRLRRRRRPGGDWPNRQLLQSRAPETALEHVYNWNIWRPRNGPDLRRSRPFAVDEGFRGRYRQPGHHRADPTSQRGQPVRTGGPRTPAAEAVRSRARKVAGQRAFRPSLPGPETCGRKGRVRLLHDPVVSRPGRRLCRNLLCPEHDAGRRVGYLDARRFQHGPFRLPARPPEHGAGLLWRPAAPRQEGPRDQDHRRWGRAAIAGLRLGPAGFATHGIPTEGQAGGLSVKLVCKVGEGRWRGWGGSRVSSG